MNTPEQNSIDETSRARLLGVMSDCIANAPALYTQNQIAQLYVSEFCQDAPLGYDSAIDQANMKDDPLINELNLCLAGLGGSLRHDPYVITAFRGHDLSRSVWLVELTDSSGKPIGQKEADSANLAEVLKLV